MHVSCVNVSLRVTVCYARLPGLYCNNLTTLVTEKAILAARFCFCFFNKAIFKNQKYDFMPLVFRRRESGLR